MDKLTNLRLDFLNKYNYYFNENMFVNYEYKINEKNDELQFECFIEVDILHSPNYNFVYSLDRKFSYNKDTGHLLGTKIKGYGSGQIYNKIIEISYEQQVELENYNLQDFQIGVLLQRIFLV